jgi:transposase
VLLTVLLKKLLRVNTMVVENVYFEGGGDGERIIVAARPPAGRRCRCGICGRKARRYDGGRGRRRWRSLDLGTTEVYLEGESPRVCCKEHGVVASQVPWTRHGARFTYDFENTVAWLTLHCSMSVVAQMMRIAWNTVGPIVGQVQQDRKGGKPDEYDGLIRIGIDETSYKKGHKYMTVVVNHDTGRLVWAGEGHGKTVLDGFFASLGEGQRASIRQVTADGERWIAESVAEWCPNAERSIDPFHVVQWATTTLDEVRRSVWREARNEAKAGGAKRGRGRPKKGAEPAKAPSEAVKGARYPLSKNPENLTAGQAAVMELIAKSNPRLYRAYLLKEQLRLLFKLPLKKAIRELTGWIAWARRCRIPQFVELQKKIGRHTQAILATIKHGLTNARIEAINNKIKLTIRMGYGFRNIDNLIALIMLRCSGVNLALPGRA